MLVVSGFTDIPQTGSTADFSDCVDVISKLHFFLFLAVSLIVKDSASIISAVRASLKITINLLLASEMGLLAYAGDPASSVRSSQSGYFLLNMAGFTENGVNFLTIQRRVI